jgi:hypothetical protein
MHSTALAYLRDSFVRALQPSPSTLAPPSLPPGGHDVAEAQPALILLIGAPGVLAVHVVQKTVDELCAGGVADEAQYEVMHEHGVV